MYLKKIAIVTPYHKESKVMIERAIQSVKNLNSQGYEIKHYLIADGHPQTINDPDILHIVLPQSHADFGDTPRMIGATLAVREGCYGLMFLDADNILYPEHLKLALGVHTEHHQDLVVAKRDLMRPDGSILPVKPEMDQKFEHVDTGCLIFFREAVFDALDWIRIPPAFSMIGDRYMWRMLTQKYKQFGFIKTPTLAYHCMWETPYIWAGETPPPNAKVLDMEEHDKFLKQLSATEVDTLNKRLFK